MCFAYMFSSHVHTSQRGCHCQLYVVGPPKLAVKKLYGIRISLPTSFDLPALSSQRIERCATSKQNGENKLTTRQSQQNCWMPAAWCEENHEAQPPKCTGFAASHTIQETMFHLTFRFLHLLFRFSMCGPKTYRPSHQSVPRILKKKNNYPHHRLQEHDAVSLKGHRCRMVFPPDVWQILLKAWL